MLKKYLFQTNKLGPISLEQFKNSKLENKENSSNYNIDELNFVIDFLKKNNPGLSSICEITKFYINENEEIEREIYYLCLKKKNKFKHFLTDEKKSIDVSFTEDHEIFIHNPEVDEDEFYKQKNEYLEKFQKDLSMIECDEYGNKCGTSCKTNNTKDRLSIDLIQNIESKNRNKKFKIFKPNLNTIKKIKSFNSASTNTKVYKPPKSDLQKTHTVICKGIPTDVHYKQIEQILKLQLLSFGKSICSIKVVKSHDNLNKGIAFIDVNSEHSLNQILSTRIIVNHMIVSVEKKI